MLNRRDWIASVAFTPLLCAQPIFLTTRQTRTLQSLGECIIPGSATARCSEIIGRILSIESPQNQNSFNNALSSFKDFADLAPDRQTQLLAAASVEGHPFYPSFKLIKEWVADTYWSSKPGLQELGWTGQMAWPTFKGCPHEPRTRDSDA